MHRPVTLSDSILPIAAVKSQLLLPVWLRPQFVTPQDNAGQEIGGGVMQKTKLTRDIVDRAVEMKRDGLRDADIIAALGVHPSTFYRWLKEGEEAKSVLKRALCDELKKAEAEYKRTLLTTIKGAALSRTQHWTAAAWLLERKYPMEYGKMERRPDDEKDAPVQLTLGIEVVPMVGDEDDGQDGIQDDEGGADGCDDEG